MIDNRTLGRSPDLAFLHVQHFGFLKYIFNIENLCVERFHGVDVLCGIVRKRILELVRMYDIGGSKHDLVIALPTANSNFMRTWRSFRIVCQHTNIIIVKFIEKLPGPKSQLGWLVHGVSFFRQRLEFLRGFRWSRQRG